MSQPEPQVYRFMAFQAIFLGLGVIILPINPKPKPQTLNPILCAVGGAEDKDDD